MSSLGNRAPAVFENSSPRVIRPPVLSRCLLVGILIVLCSKAITVQAQSATEYQVKAAFVYNFAKFVEWPSDAFLNADSALQICVMGQDPFGRDFQQMVVDKTVNGHRIEISHLEMLPQAKGCQILFIASTDPQQIRQILLNLKATGVLTVGDTPGFVQMGGVINFVLDDNRVRFEINLQAAIRAHLKLSARLLTVAKSVLPAQGEEN